MDLNDYFDPVSIEKASHILLREELSVGYNITIHTPNNPIGNITSYNLALLGIPEERNSPNKGTANAPDKIRSKFYPLVKSPPKIRFIDLGNLKPGESPTDTYFGIRDVLFELLNMNIIPVILGGSQDNIYGSYLAFEKMKKPINLVTVDPRIDLSGFRDEFDSQTYLRMILKKKERTFVSYTNIGHQVYFTDHEDLEFLKSSFFELYRLGNVRANMSEMEPVFRDANIIAIDISAIKQSDAPGHFNASPNGFFGEEICQLSKYAGISDHLSVFGIFEVNPGYDRNDQTAHLAAQMLWYFLDGFSQKKPEKPRDNAKEFREYIIYLNEIDQDLIFYKSLQTNRWWIKTPAIGKKPWCPEFISCSYEDYQKASNQEIPDRWWKAFQRYN